MRSIPLIGASAVHVGFRLAYFFYIGMRLRAQVSNPRPPGEQPHSAWLGFKRKASIILNADGVSLVAVVLLSAGSLSLQASRSLTTVIGLVLICAGVAVKAAAYRVVGIKGYYWYNFFCGHSEREYLSRGVYKYLDNPMYTVGYLHAFGFALLFRSAWGLLFALFDVLVLWAFHTCFEKPHTRLYREEIVRLEVEADEMGSLVQEDYS